jgi:hypothetical protein
VLPGGILFASLLAAQATASRVPAPTPASPAEPPEPEIVTLAATPAPAPLPTAYVPRPIVAAPPAVAAAPPAPVPVAAAPKPSPAQAAAADTGRIPVLKTRDWAGKAPVYAIHFSSFQKRENSARDAATLSKRLKLPARPVEVELGAKGTWYRTMLGEFATAEDARRAASALPEDLARAAGFVYRVQAP